ncbi:MAG TPA: dephospho-CoA kinase [bacterium]|nr:dephospho-CoA kinase [bacterium]
MVRRVINIIGAIGSGKTTAARLLAEQLQAPLIIADDVARELAQPDGPLADALLRVFPGLERTAIAHRIFTDPQAMQALAAATDPPMIAELQRRLQQCAAPLVLVEGVNLPTLLPHLVDIWVEVITAEETALARAAAAHRWPPATIRACWRWQQAQPKPEPRHTIANDGDPAALRVAIAAFIAATLS